MYIPRYPVLGIRDFIPGRDHPAGYPLDRNCIVFFDRGVSALDESIDLLALLPDDRVLLPAYICSEVVDCFLRRKIDVHYYNIGRDLIIDRADLENKIGPKVKAILVVHYFGFPQEIEYLSYLKERYCITIIEDCAHAFLSNAGNVPLGSAGSISIFTLRKTLPLLNIAILVNNRDQGTVPVLRKTEWRDIKGILKKISENIKYSSGLGLRMNHGRDGGNENLLRPFDAGRRKSPGISAINNRLLRNIDPEKVVQIRRSNFRWMLDRVGDWNDLRPVFPDLPDGICPLAFPVLLPNRDEICKLLNRRGIDAYPWPYLPRNLSAEYQDSHFLAENILMLPIHQDLKEKQLECVARELRESVRAAEGVATARDRV